MCVSESRDGSSPPTRCRQPPGAKPKGGHESTSAGGVLAIQPLWQEGLLWGLGLQWVWRRGLLRSGEPQRITRLCVWRRGVLCLKALS